MKAIKKIFDPNKLSTLLFYSSIIAFIIAFNFAHNPKGGWTQQFLPFMNDRPLSDMTFIDSLTGYGITGDGTVGDTNYIIKTSDGGENWVIVNRLFRDLTRVIFINKNTGFVCGGYNDVGGIVLKSTNTGINWFSLNANFANHFTDMFVLSEDTIWLTDDNGFNGGIFNTNNGGINWFSQFQSLGNNPSQIYMINSNTGFISGNNSTYLSRTTNGGNNWINIPSENGFYYDMYFIDSLTGWKSRGEIKKTTNGGLNWIAQVLPTGPINGGVILGPYAFSFSNINQDTIWSDGGQIFYGGGQFRGILYRSTNGGSNWYYQIPDTSFRNKGYGFVQFLNSKTGWASAGNNSNIHSTSGGDTSFLTDFNIRNSLIVNSFKLFQNYPNPFNPKTNIKYFLNKRGNVKLIVYNSIGKEIMNLINGNQNSGEYKFEFDGNGYSSGVYFYSLFIDNIRIDTKKMILIR